MRRLSAQKSRRFLPRLESWKLQRVAMILPRVLTRVLVKKGDKVLLSRSLQALAALTSGPLPLSTFPVVGIEFNQGLTKELSR